MEFELANCIAFISSTAIKTVVDDFNKRLEKKGSTRIQWIALYFLFKANKPTSQKELASLMNIQNSSLARLIDRMERDGLIRRIENPEDKRINFLELTPVGLQKAEELMPIGKAFSDLLLDGISDEEVQNFQRVLDKLVKNIKKDEN